MEEKVKAPFWKPALIYGAIVGFVGILLGLVFYVMNLMTASWTKWVSYAGQHCCPGLLSGCLPE